MAICVSFPKTRVRLVVDPEHSDTRTGVGTPVSRSGLFLTPPARPMPTPFQTYICTCGPPFERYIRTYMLFNSFESYDASLSSTLFKAETAPIRHLVKSGSDLVWSVIVRPVHGFFAAPDSCIQPNPVFPESDCTKKRFTRKSNGALC